MYSKQRQIINSHAFKHAFIQEQIRNWIKKKWFHDPLIQYLVRNYPLIQSFDMLTPLQKQGHICFGTWSPAEARSWPFFIFRLLAEAKSRLFRFVDMFTPCRSKVAFVFGTWSPAEARSRPFFIFQLPAEAKLQLLFGILCRSKISVFLFSTQWDPNKISVSVFT